MKAGRQKVSKQQFLCCVPGIYCLDPSAKKQTMDKKTSESVTWSLAANTNSCLWGVKAGLSGHFLILLV